MNRQQKELVVKLLQEDFTKCPASFVVGYKGLSVSQVQSLRKGLRDKGGRFKVAKARLMKRAVGGMDEFGELTPFFREQIGIVFALEEPPVVAKVLTEFAKENSALTLIAGALDARLLDKQSIERIAKLPSKDVLRAQLCGTLQAPIRGLATVLHTLVVRLLWVLKRIEEQKQAQ